MDEKGLRTFRQGIRSAVRGLWTGALTDVEFVQWMRTAIERELWLAFKEGIKGCDVRMEDLEREEYQFAIDAIASNYAYIDGFAEAIQLEQLYGGKLQKMLDRAELWIKRYDEMVSLARTMICENQKLEWVLGKTEQHCDSCIKLNGKVKRASFWKAAGVHPQGAPNNKLECGGWLCDCRLRPTNKKVTPGPLPLLP